MLKNNKSLAVAIVVILLVAGAAFLLKGKMTSETPVAEAGAETTEQLSTPASAPAAPTETATAETAAPAGAPAAAPAATETSTPATEAPAPAAAASAAAPPCSHLERRAPQQCPELLHVEPSSRQGRWQPLASWVAKQVQQAQRDLAADQLPAMFTKILAAE